MKIGKTIKKRRLELKLKQRDLAFKVQLSPEYIGKIERGIVENVGIKKLEVIANALMISLPDLIKLSNAA